MKVAAGRNWTVTPTTHVHHRCKVAFLAPLLCPAHRDYSWLRSSTLPSGASEATTSGDGLNNRSAAGGLPHSTPPAPTATVPHESSTATVPQQHEATVPSSAGGSFSWYDRWYPVAAVSQLEPDRPHSMSLLDLQLVLWRDAQGQWRAFEDKCPHRLAPLSEGRIEPTDGTLMCSYHGWRFDVTGACTLIPQADDDKSQQTATSSGRSCVSSYPCTVSQGLVWLWPKASPQAFIDSAANPPPAPEIFQGECATQSQDVTLLGDWFIRDFPFSWDHLVENLIDPSHIPFVHHNVVGNRSKSKPTQLTVVDRIAPDGSMVYEHDGAQPLGPGVQKVRTSFKPPCYYLSQSVSVDSKGKERAMGLSLWFYAVPTGRGRSRLFGKFFLNARIPIVAWFSRLVPWYFHLANMDVTDGDMLLIAQQEYYLKQNGGSWRSLYYMPAPADRGIISFRSWLDSHVAKSAPPPMWLTPDSLVPALQKPRAALLDRWSQHTQHCKECQGAMKGCKRVELCCWVAAVVALAAAFWVGDFQSVWGVVHKGGLVGVSVLCAFAAYQLQQFKQRFYFVDYVHATR